MIKIYSEVHLNAMAIVISRFLRPLSNTDQCCSSLNYKMDACAESTGSACIERELEDFSVIEVTHTQQCRSGSSASCSAL
jgi:hypothetical protein